jgi:hypothetical protein
MAILASIGAGLPLKEMPLQQAARSPAGDYEMILQDARLNLHSQRFWPG